jgi:hypothetical protein
MTTWPMFRPVSLLVLALFFSSFLITQAGAKEPENAVEEKTKDVQDKETDSPAWKEVWDMVKVGTQWFISYGWGEDAGAPFNRAHIGRGYVNIKLIPVEWFTPRVTIDTHQDDEGDWKVRLKYLYGKFRLPLETSIITNPYLEFGIVHTPWFDFEEHINWYRMQGTMFIERNGLLNSADLGLTLGGLIGNKLDKKYRDKVNPKYPGKYGSFALGMYNGGGYHAKENNQNKVFQSRLSVRPLGFVLPGLQFSYLFIYGKGNSAEEPAWLVHNIMASFEHEYFVVTGQYTNGQGNQKGEMLDAGGQALDFQGFSVFAEIKLPWIMSTLIGRYDWFDWDKDGGDPTATRMIAGYAFHFLKHNFILLSYDRVSYADDSPEDWEVKLSLQVKYPPK